MAEVGEMLEWLKRHAWKACVPQKGIASSNLALSAIINKKPPVTQIVTGGSSKFTYIFTDKNTPQVIKNRTSLIVHSDALNTHLKPS